MAVDVRTYLKSVPNVQTVHQTADIALFVHSRQAWIVLDLHNRPVNVINLELMSQVDSLLFQLTSLTKSNSIDVVVFTSGKLHSFIAGADIAAMYPQTNQSLITDSSRMLQSMLNRFSLLNVSTIAAIDGAALGAGCEIALTCTYRVASDHIRTVIGLPEVKLGLLPGSGGTVRLPKVVGLQQALAIILTGDSVNPKKALSIGLIDAIFPSETFFADVSKYAASVQRTPAHRQYPNPLWSGSIQDRLLDGTRLGWYLVSDAAVRKLDKQTRGQYPAPYLALDSTIRSLQLSETDALNVESVHFGELAVTPQSKALIALYFLTEESKKRKERTNGAPPIKINQIGIVGAGVMGAQIACLLAGKGMRVYMRDINAELVAKGLAYVKSQFDSRIKRQKMTVERASAALNLVTGGTEISGFSKCELVIEAAVERMDLKKRILTEIEQVLPPNAIFATNTSSLSITELSSVSQRPQHVIGIHFFNPVHRMPLVEIIHTSRTDDVALATAYQFTLDIGKTPVMCADGPGFIVNRILGIYMNEAGHLALEGRSIEHVDRALVEFGMPMGPFRLMDEVGLDVAAHVGPILESGLGSRYAQVTEYRRLLADNPKLLGKKSGLGFYMYNAEGKERGLNSALIEQLTAVVRRLQVDNKIKPPTATSQQQVRDDIVDRCVLLMINEAAYILSEGVVKRPEDIDLAMVMGTGFAPFYGGLLAYADARGLQNIVDRLTVLASERGPRFKPHRLLVEMAAEQKRFFPNRPDVNTLKPIRSLPRSKLHSKL